MCNSQTQRECIERGLFGTSQSQAGLVRNLLKTSRLFLFNLQSRVLIGPFRPVSEVALNIVPDAWCRHWGSRAFRPEDASGRSASPFPVQIRVRPEVAGSNQGAAQTGCLWQLHERRLGNALRYSRPPRFEQGLDENQAALLAQQLLHEGSEYRP